MLKVVGALALVNAISQLLQFMAQPWLAQLYPSSDFGEFAQLSSVAMFIAVLATMQFHNYLVMVKNDKYEFDRIFSISMILSFVASIILCGPIYFLGNGLFGATAGIGAVIYSSLLVLLISVGAIVKGGLVAQGDFAGLMWFTLIRSLALVVTQSFCGWLQINDGLIAGLVFAEFVALLLAGSFIKRHFSVSVTVGFISSVRKFFTEKKDFFVIGTIQELVSVAAFALPLYMFSRVYGHAFGGQFAMAHKMSWAPILLVAQSTSSVFFRYLSDKRKEEVKAIRVLSPVYALLLVSILGGIGFFVFPVIFGMAFGDGWVEAATISSWLVIWAISFLISLPYRLLYRIHSYQRLQLLIDGIVLAVGLCLFLNVVFAAEQVVFMLSVIGVIQNLALMLIAYFIIIRADERINQVKTQ